MLGILLIVMVALITGIVLLFRMIFQSVNSQGELMQAASQNAQALSSQNGTALAGMMPEGYWDYLDETYGVSRETSKNQLNSYLGSSSLYLETEQTPAKVGFSWWPPTIPGHSFSPIPVPNRSSGSAKRHFPVLAWKPRSIG